MDNFIDKAKSEASELVEKGKDLAGDLAEKGKDALGHIVEEGTFEELRQYSQVFQELWRHQEEGMEQGV